MCAKSCKACCKICIGAIIFIALAVAITVSISHQQATIGYIIFVSRFFDIMLPILAVGALLKYLLCHGGCCCHCGDKKDSSCCKSDK